MPILLTTAYDWVPGHGESTSSWPMVAIINLSVKVFEKSTTLTMQYGTFDGEGNWIPSPAPPHKIRIQNIPAVVQSGFNEQGEWEEMEVTPANPVFDIIAAGMVITVDMDGSGVLQEASRYLLQWLIDEDVYSGVIIV